MPSGAVEYIANVAGNQAINVSGLKNRMYSNKKLLKQFEDLSERYREDFFSYLDRMGLVTETGMLVIPSTRHYFFDAEDLKEVQTVVSLKQLNHVREMKDFIRTLSNILQPKSSFVGCFVDNKLQNGFSDDYLNTPVQFIDREEAYENGIESKIPFINRMYSFIDARTNRYLTRKIVRNLLEECGLQIIGMTELNGLTYFCTRKIKPAA